MNLMWTCRRHRLALLLGAMVVAMATMSPAVATTGDPVVAGQVRHGLEGVGVADVDVLLLTSEGGEPAELQRTTTDADGAFRFDGAPRDVELEVVAMYDGAPSRSGPFLGTPEGNTDLQLLVYETTGDPAEVRISSWVVWVDRDLGVTFQHDLQVDNTGDRTWLGFDPDDGGARAVLAVPLHPDAFGLGFLGRFTECCSTMRGNEYVHTSPLPPGRTSGTVRYAVESTDRLDLTTRLPVDSFTLMLPEGVAATGATLERSGEIESRGTAYGVYTLEGWGPGEPLTVGLSGLGPASTPWTLFAAAVAGALLVTAGVGWWWRRQRPGAASEGPDVTAMPESAGPGLSSEVLLEELALLDLALERGLISDRVHHELRTARAAELRALTAPAGR